MRLIGTLPGEAEARRFCDYMVTQRVDCHIEPGMDHAWQIWIEHDDELDRGRAELAQFLSHPADPRYAASAAAQQLRNERQKAAVRRQRNFKDVRTTMFGTHMRGAAPVTAALVGLCVLVTLLTGWGQNFDSPLLRQVVFQMPSAEQLAQSAGGEIPQGVSAFDNIRHGQVWRLITPIFIHFGALHLLCDVIFLWQFGSAIERMKGSGIVLLLVLLTAVLGNGLQGAWMAWRTPHAWALFGGISGVDAGLFGYVWMCGKFRPYEGLGVSQYNIGLILGWLVLCSIGAVGPIANMAHWVGLAVGMALGVAPTFSRRVSR